MSVVDYIEEMTRADIVVAGDRRRGRDPMRIRRRFMSIARSTGAPHAANTLAKDLPQDGASTSDDTVRQCLEALDTVMLIERIPIWSTHIRSRASTRSNIDFADPSLTLAGLSLRHAQLLRYPGFVGIVFENLVMRDLLEYAQHIGCTVSYHRDSNGMEVDAVPEHSNGTWAAIEIKLGPTTVDRAVSSLLRFEELVDSDRKGNPLH
ncbi:MAG: DUF4143 domain-containing protein [Candidatus Kapabacteria bacterium]|nr:DUF4143 domain-containing protein [Candidatus Kapabacteria bacterium]